MRYFKCNFCKVCNPKDFNKCLLDAYETTIMRQCGYGTLLSMWKWCVRVATIGTISLLIFGLLWWTFKEITGSLAVKAPSWGLLPLSIIWIMILGVGGSLAHSFLGRLEESILRKSANRYIILFKARRINGKFN